MCSWKSYGDQEAGVCRKILIIELGCRVLFCMDGVGFCFLTRRMRVCVHINSNARAEHQDLLLLFVLIIGIDDPTVGECLGVYSVIVY